jgi:hypothetical protein
MTVQTKSNDCAKRWSAGSAYLIKNQVNIRLVTGLDYCNMCSTFAVKWLLRPNDHLTGSAPVDIIGAVVL